ncbi:ImmA/IrrE family metallo-endopeptidase [Nocardia ninae]|uniref:ImmA/IrrE family metallo-endopeptidase n=1 Tax=Nocardia ninae TaxID=356145 RepID=UPI00164A0C25|nr:ImmA/IrrE family metallo-endopeptidase [Nocardia ninae]
MTDIFILRKHCEEIARTLPIPYPFNSKAFIEALIKYRGRRIELVEMTVDRDTPCGMFVATPEADYIFYAANTSPLHQEHIIAHEAAHILYNHGGTGALGEAVAPLLMKNLSPELITRVLGRTAYSESDEAEAEMLASVILIRAGRADPPTLTSRELECGVNRFGAIFG